MYRSTFDGILVHTLYTHPLTYKTKIYSDTAFTNQEKVALTIYTLYIMAWSSKVLLLVLAVSLISTPGQCQRFQNNSNSSSTVTILSTIGGILTCIAACIGCCVLCYRLSLYNQRRGQPYNRAHSRHRAVHSSHIATTTQQEAPTVVYNAPYTQYHNSTGTGGQQQQSRVLYDINHQANTVTDEQASSTSINLPEATLQEGAEPPTYQEAIDIETPPTQQKSVEPADNQPPPYALDSADAIN